MPTNGHTRLDPAKLRTFPGISADAFQHPDDRKATMAIQELPIFPQILKAISGGYLERVSRLEKMSSSFRLGPNQGRAIYRLFVRAAEILGIEQLPEIYVSGGGVNAYAFGMKKYTITLLSSLVSMMTEEELLAIIGHELGHIKCAHMVNKTMAAYLASFGAEALASLVPVLGPLALRGLEIPLAHWSQMAEFSCDRAALVVVQDPEIVACALAKIGGWSGSVLGRMDFQALDDQLKEYEQADENTFDSLLKMKRMFDPIQTGSGPNGWRWRVSLETHPLTTIRISRILRWGQSDQFREIMSGSYPREQVRLTAAGQPYCLSCGQGITLGDEYCGTCGAPQPVPAGTPCCPNQACRRPVSADQKFCSKCGQDLGLAATESPSSSGKSLS
jgi:Zn-dependent protease with chaperone function